MNRNHFVRLLAASFALAAIACSPASQAQQRAGAIVLEDPWSAATAPGARVAAGYLTIRNTGASADRLLSASTARAGHTELHEMSMDNGVMRMRPMQAVAIPAGGAVTFAPSGMHIMFMDIDAPFAESTTIPVTLRFERQGEVQATFIVRARGAQGTHAHDH